MLITGYVRNTEPLSYEKRRSYTLEIRAEDCNGRVSDTAVLTVNVKPLCQPSWTGKTSPGRVSDTAILTVNVKLLCQPSWTSKTSSGRVSVTSRLLCEGVSDRVEFVPRDSRLLCNGVSDRVCCVKV